MQLQIQRRLGMVRADTEHWTETVKHHIEEGSNFLLLLPKEPEAVERFCRIFGLPADCTPKTLKRSDFFRLSQFIEPEAFDNLLAEWGPDKQLVFVEQLDFPVNRPPRRLPFLVYSSVLGIVAQASTMAGAKEALEDYAHGIGLPLPEASIYIWQKNRWNLYEGR
jgi:hypothetical protein